MSGESTALQVLLNGSPATVTGAETFTPPAGTCSGGRYVEGSESGDKEEHLNLFPNRGLLVLYYTL